MRRVDTEGDSRGSRGRNKVGGRPAPSTARSHARRASLEALERRELLSTLPTPLVASTANLVSTQTGGTSSANSPSVAIDPINPNKLVAAWVVHDTANPLGNGQVTSFVQGAFSADGGQTWSSLPGLGQGTGPNVQTDFSVSQTGGPFYFTQTGNAGVAFGRDESAYLLTSTTRTDGSSGVIDIQRYDFSGTAPSKTLSNKQIYAWNGVDAASTPVLAVDNNLSTFTDVKANGASTSQIDPSAGNVYVAWASTDTPYKNPPGNFQAQTIKFVASSDRGTNFSHIAFVDDTSNVNNGASHTGNAHYVEPTLAISQGRAPGTLGPTDAGVPGGQVSIVYDDYGTGAKAAIPFDRIIQQTDQVGGTIEHFGFVPTDPVSRTTPIAIPAKATTPPDITATTNIPFAVNITDPSFTTLHALDVTLHLSFPNLAKLSAVLLPPAGLMINGKPAPPITLFLNGVDGFGTTVNAGSSLAGVNLGETIGGSADSGPGTVFDQEAVRSIEDGNVAAPYLGHFQPVGEDALKAYVGLTGAQLTGTWKLQLKVAQNDGGTTGNAVTTAALDFTSGANPGFNPLIPSTANPENVVADNLTSIASPTPNINPAVAPTYSSLFRTTSVSADPGRVTTSPVQAPPVLPSPSVAVDNTLGAYSSHPGRIYVAYTGRYGGLTNIPADQTDIFLLASDDGGRTWTALSNQGGDGVQVNDDNSATDGFSASIPGSNTGRPQLQPQVAVDQLTGMVVVSFLDARDDPSRARVATYIAASNDGGNTFAPETYANLRNTATDAITGQSVVLGPVPDNQSANSNQDPFSFGLHQGLAVAGGRIIPVWASNENLGVKGTTDVKLSIRSSLLTEPGGPRVISSTMGPIGQPGDTVNATRSPLDGSPVANSFLLTFDRPIDPATLQPDGLASTGQPIGSGDVRVYYQDPYGATTASVNTPLSGYFASTPFTSPVTFSGHPGVPVVDGQVTVNLAGFTDLGSVTVQLVAPNGRTLTIPTTAGTTSLSTTVPLPSNMVGGAVDGSYVLKISASGAGQAGTFLGWSLQLNGVSTGLRVLSITPIPDPANPQDDGSLGYNQYRVVFDPTSPANGLSTGVGTYSYLVRPNVSDRIRNVPSTTLVPGASNAVFPGTPVANIAGSSTPIVVSGHPNQVFTSGTITASFASATPIGNAQVILMTPDGRPITLFSTTMAGTTLNLTNFVLPIQASSFLLDGTYSLGLTSSNFNVALVGWSLNLSGSTPTPNFATTAVFQNAQAGQAPLELVGTTATTSSLYLVGHPGLKISGGSIKLSLTDTNVSDLNITLTAPDGTTVFTLPAAQGTALNQNYTLPASFLGQPVDGKYVLRITDANGVDRGFLRSWGLQILATGPNGNKMDQNSDAIPGEDPETTPFTGLTPGDDYVAPMPKPTAVTTFSGPGLPSGPYGASSLPLVVPGPHIINTTVSGTGGATTGTTADNLIANDQVGSVGVQFDRNVQVVSVNGPQVLNILGPAGPITGPQTFASGGVSKVFNSTDVGRPITQGAAAPLVSTIPIANTGLDLSSLRVTVSISDVNDANLALFLIAPDGTKVTLVAAGAAKGANFTGTTFSDAPGANGLTIPIASGTAPYGLTYQPSMPLSALQGKVLDGTWSLMIVDTSPAGTPQGRLNAWSLSVTPQVPQGGILNSTLTIPSTGGTFTISNLAVQLNVTAPKASDLSAYLIAPDGTIVSLFGFVGGNGSNFANTTFDDTATQSIAQGVAPFTQTYRPYQQPGFATLTSLRGKPLDGTWTLRIIDPFRDGQANAATLNSWSLIATPQIKVTPQETYVSTDTSAQNYVSTDTSAQIFPSGAATPANPAGEATPANPLTIGSALGSTLSSQIVFPSTNNTFRLANLQVALSITYPNDTNLAVSLIAPNGMSFPLFAGVGGSGANFGTLGNFTILGDSGTTSISQGVAPFNSGPLSTRTPATRIFRPASLLSALNGMPIDGTWTLQITNDSSSGQGGTLNGWALIATPAAAPAVGTAPAGATQPGEPIPVVDPSVASGPLVSQITFPAASTAFSPSGTAFTLAGLSATLTLDAGTSGNLADLSADLIAPDGVRATLFKAGDLSGTGALTRTFTPLDAISGLSKFAGVLLDGTWQLQVFDANVARPADVLTGWTLSATPQAVALKQAPEPIPNTPASSLSSTITIADNVPLNNLRLRINLLAPSDAQLSAILVGPNGKAIRLFTNIKGAGANFANTLFDDNAATSIDNGTAPFSGTFRPEDPLSNFILGGATTLGQWRLVITDNSPNPGGPTSVLYGWSLINTPPATATLANTYQITFPTQQLSGTYAVTVGAGVVGAAPTLANPQAPPAVAGAPSLGTPANPNLNAGVDVLRGTSSSGVVATTSSSYPATAVPVAIPPATTPGTNPGVLASQIVVPDQFLIQGVTAAGLPGLAVQLNITFPKDSDLAAVLIAPDGTKINLFTNVGVGSSNFTNTILDDTVNPPASIRNAGNGFSGRFNPETPLSDLKGHQSAGTWTLVITNGGSIASGLLNSWSLTFQKPLPASGLGDPVADQQTVNFRIFNIAPTNPLANDTWTAVGPAGVTVTPGQTGTFAGAVASIAYDPSDPTRNTVFVASASGGIWKTTDFLTNAAGGPTYLPLTDFGPNYSLNVGSIAVFGRNNDPSQSIVFAGTGFAQGTYPYGGGSPSFNNYGGPDGRGVGFLRSFDGGRTWSLLDSTVNVDAAGNPLPLNSPLRDHRFVGTDTYKVIVDPTAQPNGKVIVYAALGGPLGGLYRSMDSGNTWQALTNLNVPVLPGVPTPATDILFDPNSKSPTTGNLQIVYAAIQGLGVFISTNQGQSFNLMAGQLGSDPLIQGPGFPARSATVGNSTVTPNGVKGRIVLAKPAPTGNAAEDLLYQDWLYASVETADGHLDGLYITKDRGQNWTKAQLLGVPDTVLVGATLSVTPAVPTNDNTINNTYDPTANEAADNFSHNGNYNMSLSIDPTNPNIVYLGGTQDFQASGLLRVDLTAIRDAHNLTSFSGQQHDGGLLNTATTGGINVASPTTVYTNGVIYNPPFNSSFAPTPYLNFRHAPNTPNVPGTSPFDVNATLVISGRASQLTAGAIDFNNDGTGVKWSLLDEPLKANAGDLTGSSNLHDSVAFVDPVTGNVRLILANDQGVFTALLNPDGTLDSGIGTAASANYSRNGNLQNQQFYYGAAQPSNLAAQAAGALFYASGQGLLAAQSNPNVLSTGNITWDDSGVLNVPFGSGPRGTTANGAIVSSDRGGVGIATDPTGGAGGSGPSTYEYDVPSLGGNLSDFFRVNGVGQTTGLDNNFRVEFPFGNYRFNATTGADDPAGVTTSNPVGNGLIPLGNFVVNPINGNQILISSAQGTLYETVNKGVQWQPIGQASDFGVLNPQIPNTAAYASALAYGAPDPAVSANQNNFIYVGTVGNFPSDQGMASSDPGGIYVTQTGGQTWRSISSGLDGSSVVAIYPSPNQGSHEAYAVTLNGVFYSADTLATPAAGQTVWTNITGNLAQIQRNAFGNPALGGSALAPFEQQGYLVGPEGNNSRLGTQMVGGFRSIVADYRYAVPDPINPAVTYPVLYVAGYGGVFRSLDNGQSWTAFPNTSFDAAPVDGGYLPSVAVTNLQLNLGAINPATGRPVQVPGDPEVLLATTYGRGEFAIRLAPDVFPSTIHLDATSPPPGGSASGAARGNPLLTNVTRPFIDGISELSNFGNVVTITLIDQANGAILGTGITDAFGRFSIQVGTYLDPTMKLNDPSFLLDGVKNVGIQATDSSGAKGNVTTFTYTLKVTRPVAPGNPILEAASDSGRFNNDRITNVTNPTFDIATTEPATSTIQLYRLNYQDNLFDILVGQAQGGISPVSITDNAFAQLVGTNPVNTLLVYQAVQVDQAGNVSNASGTLTIAVKTTLPPTLAAPTLDPASNSGLNKSQLITNVRNPLFNVGALEAGDQLQLYRSIGGATPNLVGTAPVGATQVMDQAGVFADGTYLYQVVQTDIAGNISKLSQGLAVTINTQAPPQPTIALYGPDDSGAPAHPDITNVRTPRFNGNGTPGLGIVVLIVNGGNYSQGIPIAATTVAPDGTYLAQTGSASALPDGTYTLVAQTTNAAGNVSYSTPLVITIRATGPQIIPTLSIYGPDDTGVKGDGVTANRRPRFVGRTDPGDTVTLYAIVNGQLTQPQATAIASTVNGTFTFQLPFNLSNGSTQLVAQASDVAGNKGQLSPALNVRIITVAGDYYNTGSAQFTVFRPTSETYIVRNAGALQVDTTPGRDIPVQYDYNGDGSVDLAAYRFNSAEYFGYLSGNSVIDQQFGTGGLSLPVSGYYDASGTFEYGLYNPNDPNSNTGVWGLAVPRAGGEILGFGVKGVDIPVPAAYDGGGITEIATFRPASVFGGDADSFNVVGPNFASNYQVSFTSPAVTAKGFAYKPGDIPAPADYDGVGRDEFAIYRPSTGQFFILNTNNNLFNPAGWTLRTVTLNIPGGPRVGDVPASLDYEGTGKASPTVYRPSNSTFYEIQTTNGIQQDIQFGQPGVDVAAAGPLLYRLSALFGPYATTDGYPATVTTTGGGSFGVTAPPSGGSVVRAAALVASAASSGTPSALAASSTIALAAPMAATPNLPASGVSAPAIPASAVATPPTAAVSIPSAAASAPAASNYAVTVGAPTPTVNIPLISPSGTQLPFTFTARKPPAASKAGRVAPAASKPLAVETNGHSTRPTATPAQQHEAIAAALNHVAPIKRGRHDA